MRSRSLNGLAAAAVAFAMAAWPAQARADDEYEEEGRPALVLYVHGGLFSPLTHLDEGNDVEFETGFNLGGGAAYRINRYLALRGNFTFARADLSDVGVATIHSVAGDTFNRYLYDADLQIRRSFNGLTPYVFFGAGGVTVERDERRHSRGSFTKWAGKFGAGLSYPIPPSNASLYIETSGWVYTWDRYGFDKVQLDMTLSLGISYRFGL